MLSPRLGGGLALPFALSATLFSCKEPPEEPRTNAPEPRLDAGSSPESPGVTPSDGEGRDAGRPSPPPVNVRSEDRRMDFGGASRHYILQTPNTYDASRTYPLVMVFHGSPGNAANMAKDLPFDAASDGQAIIVYPEARSPSAAGGNFDWDLYTPTQTNADMSWIVALVDELRSKVNIDASKVLAFGFSGGAFFTTQLACRVGGLFKAIAINSGGGPDEAQMGFEKRSNGCYVCPGGPVATLVVHGQVDEQVPVSSGAFTANCFASTNGCGESTKAASPAPCEAFEGCPADAPVRRCFIPNQKHTVWPSATAEAWSFFRGLP